MFTFFLFVLLVPVKVLQQINKNVDLKVSGVDNSLIEQDMDVQCQGTLLRFLCLLWKLTQTFSH